MQPIQQLLHRIRWDPEFGRADFELAYLDHCRARLVRVPLGRVRLPAESPEVFETCDATGESLTIPLHRIRRVYRNGTLIWQRNPPGEHFLEP